MKRLPVAYMTLQDNLIWADVLQRMRYPAKIIQGLPAVEGDRRDADLMLHAQNLRTLVSVMRRDDRERIQLRGIPVGWRRDGSFRGASLPWLDPE